MTGIHAALVSHMPLAILAILLAAFFDGIDGCVARKLGASSRFGAELDSLSDFATFGIAPAVIFFVFSLHHLEKFGWAAVLLFSMGMALRLARFNTHSIENTHAAWMEGLATGVPAPAGAYLLLLPVMIHQWIKVPFSAGFCAAWSIFVAVLLVSRIPTFLFKGRPSAASPQRARSITMGFLLYIGLAYSFTWATMVFTGVAYLLLMPVSCRLAYCRKKILVRGNEKLAP
ncbi:hypothetical protein AGMMS49949_06670 [Alphaproteobacteria bacterium]|nr:hypothetical protein AGMMS49949_06670 [Alphaproteobacteria bacterium]GHS98042.1 hypothetical protein AGMMS50296_5470 [Alphaproteobacteria bacterium]